MVLTLDSGTARAPTDGLVNVFLVYVGQASGGALLLRYCDLVSKLPLNFPDWVFPLETHFLGK